MHPEGDKLQRVDWSVITLTQEELASTKYKLAYESWDCIYSIQETVERSVVDEYKQRYLNGERIEPPTAFKHPERPCQLVVRDGNNRAKAQWELIQEGHHFDPEGLQVVDSPDQIPKMEILLYIPHPYTRPPKLCQLLKFSDVRMRQQNPNQITNQKGPYFS